MLCGAGDGGRKGHWIGDPGGEDTASVRLVAGLDAVHVGLALFRVELGGIFQVPHAAFVHFLGDPAFVADMGVPVALVECDDDALDVGRAIARRRQPWAIGLVLGDSGRGLLAADLW
jgi:hypothetical protein